MSFDFFDRRTRNTDFLVRACYEGSVDDVKDALTLGIDRNVGVKYKAGYVANNTYYCVDITINLIVYTAVVAKGKNYKEPYRQIINLLLNANPKITTPAVQYEEKDSSYNDEFTAGTSLDKGHVCSKTLQEVLAEQPQKDEKISINDPRHFYILDVDMAQYLEKQLANPVSTVATYKNDAQEQIIKEDNVPHR